MFDLLYRDDFPALQFLLLVFLKKFHKRLNFRNQAKGYVWGFETRNGNFQQSSSAMEKSLGYVGRILTFVLYCLK